MSLVAVCGHKEAEEGPEQLRRLCIEALREMAVAEPQLIARCDGFRPLVSRRGRGWWYWSCG
jgi:hypothetical protein